MKALRVGLFLILLAAATLVALELGALAILNGREGWPSRTELQRRLAVADPESALDEAFRGREARGSNAVIHPYLGYVRQMSPGGETLVNRRRVDVPVNEYGFFGASPLDPRPPDTARVAILGGSVAVELFLYAGDVLRQTLEASPALAGRRVELRSLALGGMKQPQQLMTLNYILALGTELDVVVNVDGFNELALPLMDHTSVGVSPFYPTRWRALSATRVDFEAAAVAAELLRLRARRESLRGFFSRPGLRSSSFALAVWHVVSERGDAREVSLDAALRESLAGQGELEFQERGPSYAFESVEGLVADSIELWKRSSRLMAQLCEARGIAYFQVLPPNQYDEGSKPLTDWERRRIRARKGQGHPFQVSGEKGYPVLRDQGAALAAEGIAFLDLSQAFGRESQRLYRDACCHYVDEGYAILARRLGEAIAGALTRSGRPAQ